MSITLRNLLPGGKNCLISMNISASQNNKCSVSVCSDCSYHCFADCSSFTDCYSFADCSIFTSFFGRDSSSTSSKLTDSFSPPFSLSSVSFDSCNLSHVSVTSSFSSVKSDDPPVNSSQPPYCLSILYFNARSILPSITELQATCLASNPDIVCITESWLN